MGAELAPSKWSSEYIIDPPGLTYRGRSSKVSLESKCVPSAEAMATKQCKVHLTPPAVDGSGKSTKTRLLKRISTRCFRLLVGSRPDTPAKRSLITKI